MSVHFTILASGSRGNASLVRSGGAGVLLDLGLGPRALGHRMEAVGASWGGIAAALLTHTHGDHVRDASLRMLRVHRVPLYCHEGHLRGLSKHPQFVELGRAGGVRTYDDRPFLTPDGTRVEPIPLSHDAGPTFGFRVEARPSRRAKPTAIGYLADTGCWRATTADALADVDLLGVEFNHDVALERGSGRAPYLIARNLGDRGHLSNDQGAELVAAVIARSRPGAVKHLVLLHLSEQCNRPELAILTARATLRGLGRRASVHAADQWRPSPHLPVAPARRSAKPAAPGVGFPWEAVALPPDDGSFRLDAG